MKVRRDEEQRRNCVITTFMQKGKTLKEKKL